jgi:hypothetical protein
VNVHPLALVGNSLAVLVAATERARRGRPTLVIHPGGPWGGYFGGIEADGVRWDAGMVMYEFDSFRMPVEAPALASYAPLRRNDIGRFCTRVRDFVQRHQATRTIDTPQMRHHGMWLPDLLLANRIEALPRLACAEAARAELGADLPQRQASPWHARRKDDWQPGPDYDQASRANHGSVLHDALFAPFARQVLDRDASHLRALYHRIPWLPLYWPETLHQALCGPLPTLAPTTFSHPVGGSVADLCGALAQAMEASPQVTLRHGAIRRIETDRQGFALTLANGVTLPARRLAWGGTPRQALAALGEEVAAAAEPRLPLLLTFLRLPQAALRRRFSVLHLAGNDTGHYRVNDVSANRGDDGDDVRLTVEANAARFAAHHGAPADDAAVLRAVMQDLAVAGIADDAAVPRFARVLRLPAALPLPTPDGLAAWHQEHDRLREALAGLELVGASSGPFATSLSDQIVQGLRLAEID